MNSVQIDNLGNVLRKALYILEDGAARKGNKATLIRLADMALERGNTAAELYHLTESLKAAPIPLSHEDWKIACRAAATATNREQFGEAQRFLDMLEGERSREILLLQARTAAGLGNFDLAEKIMIELTADNNKLATSKLF